MVMMRLSAPPRFLALALCLAASAPGGGAAHHPVCPFPADDAAWLQPALTNWAEGMASEFHRRVVTPPRMVVLGTECYWQAGLAAPRAAQHARHAGHLRFAGRRIDLFGTPHEGSIRLPSDQTIKPGAIAFTTPGAGGRYAFFTIGSVTLWRTAFPHDTPAQTAAFMRGVATHELVHTQQLPILLRLDALSNANPDLGDLSDEMMQAKFGADPVFAAAMAAQKTALIAALREPDVAKRARMAAQIVAAYRSRQTTFFGPRLTVMGELEDSFLTLEGVATWFSFQRSPPAGSDGSAAGMARYYEHRSGGSWVQMHGALFAALLDSFGPQWRENVFGPKWASLPQEMELISRRTA
jgi:hypothetical protein